MGRADITCISNGVSVEVLRFAQDDTLKGQGRRLRSGFRCFYGDRCSYDRRLCASDVFKSVVSPNGYRMLAQRDPADREFISLFRSATDISDGRDKYPVCAV